MAKSLFAYSFHDYLQVFDIYVNYYFISISNITEMLNIKTEVIISEFYLFVKFSQFFFEKLTLHIP